MKIATVFKNGPSTQAVRIPKEFRLSTPEVWIEKVGETLVLTPKPTSWDSFFNSSLKLPEDFCMDRDRSLPKEREGFSE
jgi:antitoxin VapB